jgi:hypothetical protein
MKDLEQKSGSSLIQNNPGKQTMKNMFTLLAAFTLLTFGAAYAEDNLGVGVSFWSFSDVSEADVEDESGLSFTASYQRHGDLLGVELAAEIFPYRLDGDAWAPQAYLLLGSDIYAGIGVGIMNVEGDWADDPFFALKAGLNFELRPDLFLDVSTGYRFAGKEELKDGITEIDSDTFHVGVALRFAL